MIYTIEHSSEATKVIKKWKKSNAILFKKYTQILHDIAEHPRSGIGHPEALIGGEGITYSRRISANNRIIYNIYDDRIVVLIVSVEGHYGDK